MMISSSIKTIEEREETKDGKKALALCVLFIYSVKKN